MLIQGQDGCNIITTVAIIWRRPYRHQIIIREHVLESLLNHLMGSANELQTVYLIKSIHSRLAEQIPCSTGRTLESLHIIRIRPEKVAEISRIRDLRETIDCTDLSD